MRPSLPYYFHHDVQYISSPTELDLYLVNRQSLLRTLAPAEAIGGALWLARRDLGYKPLPFEVSVRRQKVARPAPWLRLVESCATIVGVFVEIVVVVVVVAAAAAVSFAFVI